MMNRLILLIMLCCCGSSPLEAAAGNADGQAMSPELAARLTRIMERSSDDPNRALAELKELAERRRGSKDQRFIVAQRAALLVQEDRLETAREELQSTLAGQPPEYAPELQLRLGQVVLMQDDIDGALAHLLAWSRYAEDPEPAGVFLLGYTYLRREQFAEAVIELEKARAGATKPPAAWLEILAYAYTRVGRTAEAVDLLETLVARRPGEARWWRQLASIYLLIEDMQGGAAGLAVAARLEDLSFADARRLARLFGYIGMPVDGAELLQATLSDQQVESSFDDQMLLAEMWILARDFDAALDALRNAARNARDGEPYVLMAQLFLQREQYPESRIALRDALAAYGEQAPSQIYYLLAITELNLDELEAAEAAITALESDPEFARRARNLRRSLAARQAL
jgi:tetratricopeptide (TPR) repeat protein